MTVNDTRTRATNGRTDDQVTVYGAGWCSDTRRSRALLDRLGVAYDYVDVDADESASRWVAERNGGRGRLPTILIGANGPILAEPTDEELASALSDAGVLAAA